MRKELAGPIGIGIAVILVGAAATVYLTRGAHMELTGSVLKVRTMELEENSSLAVVDFRFTNPADYPYVVRTCTVEIQDGKGAPRVGTSLPEVDARRVFEYYPLLGKKFNDSLIVKDKILPHASQDRMIVARFDVPLTQLETRKRLLVRIEDVDGPVSELLETKK